MAAWGASVSRGVHPHDASILLHGPVIIGSLVVLIFSGLAVITEVSIEEVGMRLGVEVERRMGLPADEFERGRRRGSGRLRQIHVPPCGRC